MSQQMTVEMTPSAPRKPKFAMISPSKINAGPASSQSIVESVESAQLALKARAELERAEAAKKQELKAKAKSMVQDKILKGGSISSTTQQALLQQSVSCSLSLAAFIPFTCWNCYVVTHQHGMHLSDAL